MLSLAGDPWQSDEEPKKLIKKVSDECAICKIYRKTPQRPIVGLPMATSFQECIAMDLKFYKGRILLHLIDQKFLKNNCGDFANSKFIDMAESMNITSKVTAAESPFSNGLVERYNFIIADMMDKVLEESQYPDVDLTLAWRLNAKNSLANMHGFSPFQFVFGQNPKVPSTFPDKPPVLIQHDTSRIVTDNLTALHKPRQAFISSESSEGI